MSGLPFVSVALYRSRSACNPLGLCGCTRNRALTLLENFEHVKRAPNSDPALSAQCFLNGD
jgi:hypothetical protein